MAWTTESELAAKPLAYFEEQERQFAIDRARAEAAAAPWRRLRREREADFRAFFGVELSGAEDAARARARELRQRWDR